MSRESTTSQQLNALAIRGTGFPEECLRGSSSGRSVLLTQATDVFTARHAEGAASCVAIGPAWSQEEGHVLQILEQVPEGTVVILPAGDLKLAHLIGARGFSSFETYSEDSDWTDIVESVVAHSNDAESQSLRASELPSSTSVASRGQRKQVVFSDPASKAMLALVQRVAQVDVTALLSGPSGVGKEVVAQILHNASVRASGPFIALNCSAMPEHLVESILFGHIKGAYWCD